MVGTTKDGSSCKSTKQQQSSSTCLPEPCPSPEPSSSTIIPNYQCTTNLTNHRTSPTAREPYNSDRFGVANKETNLPLVRKHRRQKRPLDESESNIVNLSTYILSPTHISILNLGLSFIPSHLAKIPRLRKDFILFSDSLFSRFLPFHKERSHPFYQKPNRPSVPDTSQFPILHQYLHHTGRILSSTKCFIPYPNLSTAQILACKELSTLPNIIITKADKGDCIVILDTSYYLSLAYNHLNDNTTYKKLSADKQLIIYIFIYLTY